MTHSQPTREPNRIFPHLLPCLALAVFCTVLFWWKPFGAPPEKAFFEADIVSPQPGTVEFHSDVDGTGVRFGRAEPVKAPGGPAPFHVRFQLRVGKLIAVNLLPRAEEGTADVLRCWVTNEAGEVLAVLPPALIAKANAKVAEPLPGGALRFHSQPGDEDNGLRFKPTPPIDLDVQPGPPAWQMALVFLLSLGGALAFSLVLGERVAAARWISRLVEWAKRHPQWALCVAAAFSVMLSCFPVIFCGKSFVSPDNGLLLFYEGKPTVPGGVGGRVDHAVGSDLGATMYWHLPVSMIEHKAIFQDHEFPLWNRYNWCGVTLFAQSLSMIGDPLDWIAILTGGAAWAWDLKFVVAQWLFAFAIGLVVRRTSGSLPVAVLLALSAPFIGFFAYRYNHAAFFSLCYSPWILLAWIEGARAATVRSTASWALFLIFANWCELNSGTAKEMSALLLFINLAGGLILLLADQPVRWRAQRLGVFAGANVIFLLLSAPLWMTFLDALAKAHTSYEEPRVYQMTPGLAIGLFDDIFHRQFMPVEFLFNPSANFFVLIGVAWALVRVRALAKERVLWAMTLPAIAAAALAFGVIAPATVVTIPFLKGIYHLDNTFSCVLFILLFVIAGFGLRECLARMRHPEWRGDWLLMLTFVAVLIAAYFGLADAAHRLGYPEFLKVGETIPKSRFFIGYVPALLAALVLLPLAWRQACLRQPAATAWVLVGVCAFVTLHFRHGMYLETNFDFYVRNPKTRTDLRHLTSPAIEAIRNAATEPERVFGLGGTMVPGFSAMLGFETLSGPEALMNPAMLRLVDTLGFNRIGDWRVAVKPEKFAEMHRALDMLNVRHVLARNNPVLTVPGTKAICKSDLTVYESETAWPRAFFTDTIVPYSGGAEFRQLVEGGDGRPFAAQPASLQARMPLPKRDFAQRIVKPASNYRLTNNTTSFEIDAPTTGVAVLMEANVDDDILAYVDDELTECLPIDHAFRGVLIQKPGHHVIKFEYWPDVLYRALTLALTGLAALALCFWWWWRAGRVNPKASQPATAATEPAAIS